MTSFLRSDRSRPVAIWLAIVALFVLSMVVVGGATRLTDSGLSITEWKPVAGALPPMNAKDWNDEFARYKEIPQYKLVNRGMSLGEFKQIYWWEWGHRLLGRVLGAVFVIPAAWFLIRQELPRWLIPRMGLLLVLGGLQGLVGWWMVASGLSDRVSVAPERLATHLGLAFILLAALVWTALDAWAGAPRQTVPSPWVKASLGLTALFYFQILLGALVAGNDAGLVYNDWPMMNGALFPADYAGAGLWSTLAHSQAAVQFNHRIFAYLLTGLTAVFVVRAVRSPYLLPEVKRLALALGGVVGFQVLLGIVTLTSHVPISLGMAHQITAAILLAVSVGFAWRVRRP